MFLDVDCSKVGDAVVMFVVSFVKALIGLEETEIEHDFDWTPESYGRSVFSTLFSETEKMKVCGRHVLHIFTILSDSCVCTNVFGFTLLVSGNSIYTGNYC